MTDEQLIELWGHAHDMQPEQWLALVRNIEQHAAPTPSASSVPDAKRDGYCAHYEPCECWPEAMERCVSFRFAPPANPVPSGIDALTRIKSLVCGDRYPRWSSDEQVTHFRGLIADIADAALLQANGAKEK